MDSIVIFWLFVAISVVLIELTMICVGLVHFGEFHSDHLFVGFVVSVPISSIFAFVFVKLLKKLISSSKELESINAGVEAWMINELEKRRSQEQLKIQQARLASMGEMIRSIAHHWRQPLNVIALEVQEFSDICLDKQNKKIVDQKINTTMKQVFALSRTIDDFRELFRVSAEPVKFSVLDAIKDAIKVVEASLNQRNIKINLTTYSQNCFVVGYPNEFKQILISLFDNAKDAIKEHNRSDGLVEVKVLRTDGHIEISIIDNGMGIDSAIKDKIFDPYFSTKLDSGGTGIGLYMAKNIIEKDLNGKIVIDRENDKTVVKIQLKCIS